MKPRKLAGGGPASATATSARAGAAKKSTPAETPKSKPAKTPAASEKKPTKAAAAKTPAKAAAAPPAAAAAKARVEHVPRDRVARATEALLQHIHAHRAEQASKKTSSALPMGEEEDEEGNLVAEDEIYVQFALKLAPEAMMRTFKGRPIPLPHPWRQPTDSVCLLVKDKAEAKKWLGGDDYKQTSGVAKILSLEQLRKQYAQFSQRRALANQFDVFVADDRVVCMLPKTLGKAFFGGPKRPLPMRLARRDQLVTTFEAKLRAVLGSTFFYQAGTTNSVKIGTANMKPAQLVENALAVIEGAAAAVAGGLKGLQAIHLKAARSAALPLHLDAARPEAKYVAPPSEEEAAAAKTKKPAAKAAAKKTAAPNPTEAEPAAKRTKLVAEKKKSR